MSQEDADFIDDVRIGRVRISPFDFDTLDAYLQASMRLIVRKNQEQLKKRG